MFGHLIPISLVLHRGTEYSSSLTGFLKPARFPSTPPRAFPFTISHYSRNLPHVPIEYSMVEGVHVLSSTQPQPPQLTLRVRQPANRPTWYPVALLLIPSQSNDRTSTASLFSLTSDCPRTSWLHIPHHETNVISFASCVPADAPTILASAHHGSLETSLRKSDFSFPKGRCLSLSTLPSHVS